MNSSIGAIEPSRPLIGNGAQVGTHNSSSISSLIIEFHDQRLDVATVSIVWKP